MTKFLSLCLVIVTLSLLSGCGNSDTGKEKRPARTIVSGVVSLKGAVVEGATVTLHPAQKGHGAFGVTDKAGKFTLGTFEKNDGAVPGEYKVSIKKIEAASSGSQPKPDDPGYDPNAPEVPPKNLLPEKYADFNSSGLTATVGSSSISDLKFDLQE